MQLLIKMPIDDMLIDSVSGNEISSLMDGNLGYNQISIAKGDDVLKLQLDVLRLVAHSNGPC